MEINGRRGGEREAPTPRDSKANDWKDSAGRCPYGGELPEMGGGKQFDESLSQQIVEWAIKVQRARDPDCWNPPTRPASATKYGKRVRRWKGKSWLVFTTTHSGSRTPSNGPACRREDGGGPENGQTSSGCSFGPTVQLPSLLRKTTWHPVQFVGLALAGRWQQARHEYAASTSAHPSECRFVVKRCQTHPPLNSSKAANVVPVSGGSFVVPESA